MSIAELNADLGRRIKEHRTRSNLSQAEAAQRMGVALRTMQNWEAGNVFPHPKHRRVIDRFLNDELTADTA